VRFQVSVAITGSTFDDTNFIKAITQLAADSGCSACNTTSRDPVQCTSCQIFVVRVKYNIRWLLASTKMVRGPDSPDS
jgi:hypothetical protein